MFLGDVVNLFIGLALTFGTLGLAVSTITEGIASVLKLRAGTMLSGLKQILNDKDLSDLAAAVLKHGAVNPTISATPVTITKQDTPPYIPPQQFAIAMIDILQARAAGGSPAAAGFLPGVFGGSPADLSFDLSAGIATLDPQLAPLFSGMLARATTAGVTDIDSLRNSLADWFDNAMNRLSGDYKRKTQWISLLIGLALAVFMNIDTLAISRTLWSDPQLTLSLTQASTADITAAAGITTLKQNGFPFGWDCVLASPAPAAPASTPAPAVPARCTGPQGNGLPLASNWGWLLKALGWALTASAALFGAPFWFDLLQRFIQIRSTGATPDEKAA